MLVVFISTLLFLSHILLKNRRISRFVTSYFQSTENQAMGEFLAQDANLTSNTITFYHDDQNQCYEITKQNVTVVGSTGYHDHGSSKVKLKNIVDYKWEAKNYPGHLIAVHMDGKCIAYVIKVNNKHSGTEGMVRVINSGKRALIKGMTGEVLDLQFAHIEKQHILACIEVNVLHIHKIDMLSDSLVCNLLLEIEDPIINYIPKYDKISWCPYVPDETSDSDDDITQLLVWARGNCFQCLNVNTVINAIGVGKHFAGKITDGHLKLVDASMMITWIALSPDGTTLCVGREDGYIRFYQVYFHEKEPRCLHEWNPHNGKAISSFFFLDNLTKTSIDAYWKHVLTGADRNSEFKIWDCGTWNCLQTLTLASTDTHNSTFIAEIDRTSSYLIISNIETRGLYVVQLVNDVTEISEEETTDNSIKKSTSSEENENCSNKRVNVFMKSISEFPLSSPILSFSIVDATVRKYKCQDNESFLMDELDDYDEENNTAYCVVVRMFIVQPKSVQECHILYQPTVSESADVRSTLSNESIDNYKDSLIDMTIPSNPSDESNSEETIKLIERTKSSPIQKQISNEKLNKILNSPRSSSIGHKSVSQINLMTPDSFNTTGKKTPECVSSEVLSTILMLASVTGSTAASNKTSESINLLNLVNNKMIEDQEHQKYKQAINSQKNYSSDINSSRINSDMIASGGSSPSREVQEILSLNSSTSKSYYPEAVNSTDILSNVNLQPSETLIDSGIHKPTDKSLDPRLTIQSGSTAADWTKVLDVRNAIKRGASLKPSASNGIISENMDMNDLNSKITQLLNLVQLQSMDITELKTQVSDLKKKNNTVPEMDMFCKTEVQLSKLFEEYLLRCEKEHKQRLENFISVRNTQNRELRESIMHVLNQFFFNQFTEKLSNVIMLEIQKQVIPLIVSKLDLIAQQFQLDVSQKITATDKILKENIAQVCKSKSIIDAFGNSVLIGVQSGLQTTYVQSMSETLIPAYEKSSQEMFKQLHNTFSSGIKEVMEQFDNYVCQMQPVQDGTDEILDKVTDLRKHIDAIVLKQRNNGSDITIETKKELKSMESNMVKTLTEIIQKEVRKNFESQAASLEDSVLSAVRSQAHTPAPSFYDVQDQIKHLLNQGHINKAFHQALLANDLTLVEYTLERADYKSVFNPCALEQTVLLSLIQQISADIENHNDIKQRYLSDGILNLNQQDPITKEHAPRVMKELYKNCQNYLVISPKSPLCSNIRMVMMAVQGLGYKVL